MEAACLKLLYTFPYEIQKGRDASELVSSLVNCFVYYQDQFAVFYE